MNREKARKRQREILEAVAEDLFSKSDNEILSIIEEKKDVYSELFDKSNIYLGKEQEVTNLYIDDTSLNVEYISKEPLVFDNELDLGAMLNFMPKYYSKQKLKDLTKSLRSSKTYENYDFNKYDLLIEDVKQRITYKGTNDYINDEDFEECPIAA